MGEPINPVPKKQPFVYSLGMKFVPVPITGGPTGGQRVLFSVWETRGRGYEGFATGSPRGWPQAGLQQGPMHPAGDLGWGAAPALCTLPTARPHNGPRPD